MAAVAFLGSVDANRHMIGLTKEIRDRYYGKLKAWEREKTIEGLNVNKALTSLLSNTNRQVWIDTSGRHLPKGIPEDDADFVIAAWARTGAILVTQDEPLIELISKVSLRSRGVTALTIRDGLTVASKKNS